MSLVITGILLVKVGLSTSVLGVYETAIFVTSLVSFFWLSGVTQSLLSVFKDGEKGKKQLFSSYLILLGFSALAAAAIFFCIGFYESFSGSTGLSELSGLMALFVLFSGPGFLTEYILFLKEKPVALTVYGALAYPLQVALVVFPVINGGGLEQAVYGLVLAGSTRFLFSTILVLKEGQIIFDPSILSEILKVGWPLIIGTLLSGSAEYIDGFLVSRFFDEGTFAVYRYGAKEFPLFVLMAAAFSAAMVRQVSKQNGADSALEEIKKGGAQMMNWFFPIAIALTVISPFAFPYFFNSEFSDSAFVFNAYLLTLASRMLFPQSVLIGIGKTKVVMTITMAEIVLNIGLSLVFLQFFGLVGIAYASFVAYLMEKVLLSMQLQRTMGISLTRYTDTKRLLGYTTVLVLVHIASIIFLK